jgi:hypothetical protein
MQNTDHQHPIDKTSTTIKPEYSESKTKQSHRGVQLNESDIYMLNQYKDSQTP